MGIATIMPDVIMEPMRVEKKKAITLVDEI